MTFISTIILLLSAITLTLTNASPLKVAHKHGAIYRRNDDPLDEEFKVYRKTARMVGEMKINNPNDVQPVFESQGEESLKAPPVASRPPISPVENQFDDSDEESIQSNDQSRKRRKLTLNAKSTAGLKTTGMDISDFASNDDRLDDAVDALLILKHSSNNDNHFQSKLKEENQKLIRKIALNRVFDDPFQYIQDYDEWSKRFIYSYVFRKKIKAELVRRFYLKKIEEKTQILLKNIPWNRIQDDAVFQWLPTKDVFKMSLEDLNKLLGRLDQSNLSEEFLATIKTSRSSEISEYFREKFQRKAIPWQALKRSDFVNWPEDVPVKSPGTLTSMQKQKLKNVLETIELRDHNHFLNPR